MLLDIALSRFFLPQKAVLTSNVPIRKNVTIRPASSIFHTSTKSNLPTTKPTSAPP